VELAATAIDQEGKSYGTQSQSMDFKVAPDRVAPDLPSHLPVPPGRYMVRLAGNSDGRTGTVFVDVDVPDFAKTPLSASGLVLRREPAARVTDQTIAALVPFVPTTVRAFAASEDVKAFLRVYQGGKGRIVPVRMTAKILSDANKVVSNQEAVLESGEFSETRSADYQIALPLAHLSAGDYLFEVEAQSGTRRVQRSARFRVVPAQ